MHDLLNAFALPGGLNRIPLRHPGCGYCRFDVLQNEECIAMMRDFIRARPELWNEDIGV